MLHGAYLLRRETVLGRRGFEMAYISGVGIVACGDTSRHGAVVAGKHHSVARDDDGVLHGASVVTCGYAVYVLLCGFVTFVVAVVDCITVFIYGEAGGFGEAGLRVVARRGGSFFHQDVSASDGASRRGDYGVFDALYLFGAVPAVGDFAAYTFFGGAACRFLLGAAPLLFLTADFFGAGGFGGFACFFLGESCGFLGLGFMADGYLPYLLPVPAVAVELFETTVIVPEFFGVCFCVGAEFRFLRLFGIGVGIGGGDYVIGGISLPTGEEAVCMFGRHLVELPVSFGIFGDTPFVYDAPLFCLALFLFEPVRFCAPFEDEFA